MGEDHFRKEDPAAALGWDPDRFVAWTEGRQPFNEAEATRLAEALGFDGPGFVGKVLEVLRRRDAGQGELA